MDEILDAMVQDNVLNYHLVCSSNQAIAKLTLKPGYSPYYVSSFVNCRYRQNQIARLKTVTGQPNINMGLIKYLLILKVSDEINELIEKSVILAMEKIEDLRSDKVQSLCFCEALYFFYKNDY